MKNLLDRIWEVPQTVHGNNQDNMLGQINTILPTFVVLGLLKNRASRENNEWLTAKIDFVKSINTREKVT